MDADLLLFSSTILTCRGSGRPKTAQELGDVGILTDGGIAVREGSIIDVGPRHRIREEYTLSPTGSTIDAGNWPVLPGLIDSHTHPVFAGNRVNEFIMRAQGATYQDIHAAGGGIQFTVDSTRDASYDELYLRAGEVVTRMMEHGTTTLEAKSGYGLDTEEELKELRVLRKLNDDLPVDIVPTFMGAHSIPREYQADREAYMRLLIDEMLPLVKKENLATFVDVFCEEGAFTLEETSRILEAARELGFKLKVHAEEFTNTGCTALAGRLGAASADHLLRISDQDIEQLAKTDTILTLMPGTLFFLDYCEFAPARKIISGGGKLALATDYNAGSCLSASMPMAMSLGCIKMKMTPEETINAATYNASFAVGMEREIGSIEKGKKADFTIFEVDDYRLIPYFFGENLVKYVIKNGRIIIER